MLCTCAHQDTLLFPSFARGFAYSYQGILSIVHISIYDEPDFDVETIINRVYQSFEFKHPIKFCYQLVGDERELITETLINAPAKEINLIIADNSLNDSSSAFLSALLIAHQQVLTQLEYITPHCFILRSMFADDIQPAFSRVQQYWFSQINKPEQILFMKLFSELGISINLSEYAGCYPLDLYYGKPDSLKYWLMMTFAIIRDV